MDVTCKTLPDILRERGRLCETCLFLHLLAVVWPSAVRKILSSIVGNPPRPDTDLIVSWCAAPRPTGSLWAFVSIDAGPSREAAYGRGSATNLVLPLSFGKSFSVASIIRGITTAISLFEPLLLLRPSHTTWPVLRSTICKVSNRIC